MVEVITGSRSPGEPKQRRRKPLSGGSGLLGMGCTLVMALTACAVGPNYHPTTPTLASFHNAPVGSTTAGKPTRLDEWWLAFNDPNLTRIVQRALDQNLDLAASLARVTQARAAASAAGANLLPTADLNAQAAALRQSLDSPIGEIAKNFPGYSRDQRLYDVGAQASWEIDLFGGLRRGAGRRGGAAGHAHQCERRFGRCLSPSPRGSGAPDRCRETDRRRFEVTRSSAAAPRARRRVRSRSRAGGR